jgi:hypothetical protein
MAFNSEQKKAHRQRPEVKAHEQVYLTGWRLTPRGQYSLHRSRANRRGIRFC